MLVSSSSVTLLAVVESCALISVVVVVIVVIIVRDVRGVDVPTGSAVAGTVTVDTGGLYVNTKRVDGAGVVGGGPVTKAVGIMRCAMSGTKMVVVSTGVDGVAGVVTNVGMR